MASRFTNTTFFAALIDGKRTPAATNIEEDTGEVENPDPGGDGGGGQNPGGDLGGGDQGTGGDIGTPVGAGFKTLGDPVTLTRKAHNVDVFAQGGLETVVTYVASEPCTLLPKIVTPGMEVTRSVDGKELTITWTPSTSLPGDSFRIGCEAHKYGSVSDEAITEIYDRVHLNKTSGDIKRIGVGTSWPNIYDGLLRADIKAGDTIIVNDGVYTSLRDYIAVGYHAGGGLESENLVFPNGVSDGFHVLPTYDGSGTQNGTQNLVKVTKYTTIMSESLGGVIVDQSSNFGGGLTVSLLGDYRDSNTNGFRSVHGIAVDGFAFRHILNGIRDERTDSIRMRNVSYINDVDLQTYSENVGQPDEADGGIIEPRAVGNTSYDYMNGLSNNRSGVLYGAGAPATEGATRHSAMRRTVFTLGCVQQYIQQRSQTFLFYGARSTDLLNCWSVDGGFFRNGFRNNLRNNAPVEQSDHFSFQATNQGGDDCILDGCLSLKDCRSGWNNTADPDQIKNTVRNSVFWDKFNPYSDDPIFRGGVYNLENVTAGKNSLITFKPGATFDDNDSIDHTGCLSIYSSWDYPKANNDTIANGFAESGVDTKFVFAPKAADSGYLSDVDDYLVVPDAAMESSGLKYLGRVDEGTSVGDFGAGCANIFAEVGSYLDEKVSADHANYTRYDGRGGRKYINWISNAPWRYWRRERAEYSCTVNGTTYTGAVGAFAPGVHPTDYVNRQGTSPLRPENTPFIDDIYGYMDGSKAIIRWRPVCPAYRATVTGYDLYIDGILVAENQSKELTGFEFDGVDSGTRLFNVIVKDSVTGKSGTSRTVFLTIP